MSLNDINWPTYHGYIPFYSKIAKVKKWLLQLLLLNGFCPKKFPSIKEVTKNANLFYRAPKTPSLLNRTLVWERNILWSDHSLWAIRRSPHFTLILIIIYWQQSLKSIHIHTVNVRKPNKNKFGYQTEIHVWNRNIFKWISDIPLAWLF